MRYSLWTIAPFMAAAYAQDTTETTAAPESTTSISIPPYSNTLTNFLTETNSYGVVTGMPGVSNGYNPAAATEQPAIATIPAGLPSGAHTLFYGNASSFTISVGSSTTVVLGAGATGVTGVTTGANAASTNSSESGSDDDNNADGTSTSGSGASASESGSASESSSAANANIKAASGAMFGLGALVAFVL